MLYRTVKIVHIIAGVAVIGELWGMVLMELTALGSGDRAMTEAAFAFSAKMVIAGGIPLSMLSLATGLFLVFYKRRWSFKQVWVTLKLLLQLGVIFMGMLVVSPSIEAGLVATDPVPSQQTHLVAVSVQIGFLATATLLSIFKPGRRGRGRVARARAPRNQPSPA